MDGFTVTILSGFVVSITFFTFWNVIRNSNEKAVISSAVL